MRFVLLLLALGCALLASLPGVAQERGASDDSAGHGGSAAVSSPHVALKSFPAIRSEKIALDSLAERFRVLQEEGQHIQAEAASIRGLPRDADLRWDPQARDGAWILYGVAAPLDTASHGETPAGSPRGSRPVPAGVGR